MPVSPSLSSPKATTTYSLSFTPESFIEKWASQPSLTHPHTSSLRTAINQAFNLKEDDGYIYHAIFSVTLVQVQEAIDRLDKDSRLLFPWYRREDGVDLALPPPADIEAYISLFSPSSSPLKSLTSLSANAKKASARSTVAAHLLSHHTLPTSLQIAKKSRKYVNPYLDFWAYSCRHLGWAGPNEDTVRIKQAHPILPILYHHFGCACPSFEALEVIRRVCTARGGEGIIEIGSGNGYWAFMLRRMGIQVTAVDSLESEWRTVWIGDTVVMDGREWLQGHEGGRGKILLLVYPVTREGFTSGVLEVYRGGAVCVVGTQNQNGYTGFRDREVEEFVREKVPRLKKTAQIPLPSFAGKDDALFVFEET